MKDVLDIFLKYVLPFIAAYLINIVMNKFLSKEFLRGKIHLIFLKGIVLAIVWAAAALTALGAAPSGFGLGTTGHAVTDLLAVHVIAKTYTNCVAVATFSYTCHKNTPYKIDVWWVSNR